MGAGKVSGPVSLGDGIMAKGAPNDNQQGPCRRKFNIVRLIFGERDFLLRATIGESMARIIYGCAGNVSAGPFALQMTHGVKKCWYDTELETSTSRWYMVPIRATWYNE